MELTFGSRLKKSREECRYSHSELAEMAGVAKQSIYKFESDELKPGSETLLKFCDIFRKSYAYFRCIDEQVNYNLGKVRFRHSQVKMMQTVTLEEIREQVITEVANQKKFEAFLEIERVFENPVEEIKVEDEKDIEKAAKLLRKKWKLGIGPIYDVVETIENNGVYVVEINYSDDFSGMNTMINDEIPVIVLNQNCKTLERKRFTAVHELAHAILKFKGAVLILEEALYNEWGKKRTVITLAELKKIREIYGISIEAIIVRARVMGYIDGLTYKDWMDAYEDWYARGMIRASQDFNNTKERPVRMENLLVRAIYEKRISWLKAAEILNTTEDYLLDQYESLVLTIKN
jgi:Zn-dependent peptidase ImmA (M78 family)/DNA-binding XRE family transcriptional regulator